MPVIHYFQRYSQKENVVTNNTLLLLARLYELSPDKFQAVLNAIFQREIEVGVGFTQQTRREGEGSVPDGLIRQRSFQIVIEAKRGNDFSANQLIAHLKSFTNADQHFLLAIGASLPSNGVLEEVKQAAAALKKNISVEMISYTQLIEIIEGEMDERDYEFQRLLSDYRDFCNELGLLPIDKYLMRLVLANKSKKENLKYNIYYDQRGFRDHKYIGLYGEKAIYAVGEIENIIQPEISENDLKINWSKSEVTEEQKEKILQIEKFVFENKGWNIRQGHYFFCVKEFFVTDYKKSTPRAPMGTKFFNLKNILNVDPLPSTAQIAEILKEHTWDEYTR